MLANQIYCNQNEIKFEIEYTGLYLREDFEEYKDKYKIKKYLGNEEFIKKLNQKYQNREVIK
jgi:hypothetical protein